MAAKLGFEVVKQAMLRLLMKKGDDGIVLTLPKNEIVDYNAKITMDRLISNGIDPNSLTSPDQVLNVLDNINNQAINNARVISADSVEGRTITDKLFGKKGEVIEFPQKRTFKEEIEAMKKSGDIVDVDDVTISEKITNRDMFKNSNLNKRDSVTDTITYIKTLEPMDAMKEANSVIGRKGKYKNLTPEESKKILTDTEDHIFERDIPIDPEDMAKGGIAGYYTGGMVDVEPNLSDIGHGSDALMARTRLVSPDGQATTSTGLNYLLAEDNDNIRVPFSKGKLADAARRKFMKTAGAAGAGIAALKTGLLGFADKAAPVVEKTAEAVSNTAGQVPAYFLNLVQKIKNLGEDITEKAATLDRQKVTKYKDFELTEDVATGEQTIQRMKVLDDGSESYYGKPLTEETYMNYKPGAGQADESTKGIPPDEYEEGTAYLRNDKEFAGEIVDESFEISDDIIEEGTKFEDNLSDFGKTKKADGGRIGFNKGKLVFENAKKFLEKVFGKESMEEMPNRDPEMYQGMLEVVDMFRNRDKEGLKKYLQRFLPHMDDAQVEDLIVGDAEDMAGLGKFGLGNIQGQLIRLGSGRDYAGKIEAVKRLERNKSLKDLEVTEDMQRKPNALGGLAKMLGE